jgi:threonylcarbamoyladenosine tRNA methylthiotransferase MtaB
MLPSMMHQKTFQIATLGCRTNQYESQAYRAQLEALGFREAAAGERADLCLVNSCTVTAGADRDSRHAIRRLKREHPTARIVVTGCLVERGGLEEELPEIDLIVSNLEKELLIQKLFPDLETYPEFQIDRFASHTRAFVKVQDGCNSYCTYCVIPYVRGRSRSRSTADVIREVEGIVAQGYQEIVLTGINIGDFDGGKKEQPDRLCDLVRAVDQVEGVRRLRISSIDPDEVDDELLEAVLGGRNTCHAMHIVLQAGSNVVLKRMNRKYTRQLFFDSIERLRKASPDFGVTTDILYGFPGETERDVEETAEVMREVGFAKSHLFPYSKRPRTRAALYPNQVGPEEIAQRRSYLSQVAEESAYLWRERFVGRRLQILTEGSEAPGEISGYTDHFAMTYVTSSQLQSNQLVEVKIVENSPRGLIGVEL